ncbi:MAG: acyloxyacyl hydrolase [Nitrospiraceae bacterium]|nr:acyloxyacyl hydrolase [Nitrospiraceae bacterium]
MPYLVRVLIALVLGSLMTTSCLYAENVSPAISVGTQELGLSAGYLIPHLLKGKKSKTEQSGLVFMPSWMMTLTDPIGDSWYRGQISFGAEMAYIQFQEPVLTHGVGFTPKIKYTFVALDRIRPYAEFAGGPFWTDLGGKIPEQSSQFNFILSGGFGVSYFLNNQVALNAGYRFQHISNAHTSRANVGLNSSLPFIGFSFYF